MAKTERVYPDNQLIDHLRAAGLHPHCMWQVKGPKDTSVAWMECWMCSGQVFIIQTFKGSAGGWWEVFLPCRETTIPATINEVINRLKEAITDVERAE